MELTPIISHNKSHSHRLSSKIDYESLNGIDNFDLDIEERHHPKLLSHKFKIIGVIFFASILFAVLSWPKKVLKMDTVLTRETVFKQISHPEKLSSYWGSVKKPYPTGSFWTNLVVKNGDGPIAVLPYGVKTLDTGIQISYGPTRRSVSQLAVSDPFVSDIQLSSVENYISRSVESYDSSSVTMSYITSLNGKYKTPLVKGCPFITVIYENSTPSISSTLMKITSFENRVVKDSTVGVQYIITLGNYQKWLLFCSENVEFTLQGDTISAARRITTGYIRIAILPVANFELAFFTLLQYVQKYPTGGPISVINESNSISSDVVFQFKTVGSGLLLMLALPHQIQIMTSPVDNEESRHVQSIFTPIYCMKGKLKPVLGDSWKLTYPLKTVSWNYALLNDQQLSIGQMDEIARNLLLDVKNVIPQSRDTYGFGKEIARMAQLAELADYLGMGDARQLAINTIQTALTPWLNALNPNTLVYDTTYGGLVTSDGILNADSDFGNGWYNDHHFHYGYFIFAAAVLAKLSPLYFMVYQTQFAMFVRDVCNPDAADPDFPYARHKDLFDGHSWASGLLNQANGKNQESSSEAVNAYYACYLYGLSTSNPTLSQHSRTMLAMETQAVKYYWHMTPNSLVYDALFASNVMVGNVAGLDVTASTWFGNNPEYVHGINMMPLTPASALLFDPAFARLQWPALALRLQQAGHTGDPLCSANKACAGLEGLCCPTAEGLLLGCCDQLAGALQPEWKALILAVHALLDRDTAWSELLAHQQQGFGSGNSRSNSLYWAASRPPPLIAAKNISTHIRNLSSAILPACSANSGCSALGLGGQCCPVDNTSPAIYLGCCPHIVPV